VLVTPRQSALADSLDPAAVLAHLTGTGAEAAEALATALAAARPAAIVVDDVELLTDTPLGNELVSRQRGLRDSGHRMLAAASGDSAASLRGLIPALAKGRCGLILEPASPADGTPFGTRLPVSVLAPGVPLRGALIHNGRVTAVQVPALPEVPADRAPRGADQAEGR
jgi:S-DNA-T family DNA segregation ATPase FtsK/SpoIIIE